MCSAKRNNRRLIAVVFGAPSGGVRAVKAAQMLERGFQGGGFSWLTPTSGTVETLKAIDASPPNLRDEICGKKRKRPAADRKTWMTTNTPRPLCRPVWIRARRRL